MDEGECFRWIVDNRAEIVPTSGWWTREDGSKFHANWMICTRRHHLGHHENLLDGIRAAAESLEEAKKIV